MSSTAMLALLAGAALVARQGGAQAPAPAQSAGQSTAQPAPVAPQGAPVGPDGVQRPTFRAQIDYVEVSAIVTDDDGNLVPNLTKDDFQILENGKPQSVSVFTPVNIPFQQDQRTLIEGRPLKFDVANNDRVRDGRVYVIVLDDYHIGALRSNQVKRAAREFVEKHMAANDQVAVIHASGRSNASQEFTTNKDLILASIDKFIGMKIRSATVERLADYRNRVEFQNAMAATSGDENAARDRALDMLDPERAFNARSAMDTLRNLSRLLESVNGSRKSVLFFSEGIDYNIVDIMGVNTGSRYASDVLYAMRDAIGAATRSNVAYYTIDPRGLVGVSDDEMDMEAPPQDVSLGLNPWNIRDEQRLAQMSLMSLAEETGGAYSINSNDFSKIYDRIVRDSSTYYLLGYYPTDERRNGSVRRIQVKVNRPDVKVFARKAYQAPKDKEEKRITESASGTSPEVRAVLNSALPTPGLNLSVHAAPFKGADKKASVAITVQVEGDRLALKETGDTYTNGLEISMMAMDLLGKVPDGDRASLDLKLRKQTRDLMAQTGIRSVATLDLPPGRYQLRVAARESNNGAVGSVFTDLEVPDFSEPFTMSGILLSSSGSSLTPTPRMDEELKKLLPAPPTTTRGFATLESIFGYVDVYDSLQPAHGVDITTTVTRVDGTKVFSTTEERKSSEFGGGKGGGYGAQFQIPLKDFAPGLYVLKVEAKPRIDKPAISRELTFAVYGPPTAGTAASETRVVPIAHGPLSNGSAARESVVRSPEEWGTLWASLPTKQAAPQVAFDQMMVVGVFVGNRPTTGYKVEITGARKEGDALVVLWREIPPVQGSSVNATVTTPFAVAGLPRHDGPVKFEKVGS